MAATYTTSHQGRPGDGDLRMALVDMAMAASDYPTGGYPISPGACGLNEIFCCIAMGAKGYQIYYDHTSRKILFFRQTAGTGALVEVPNATDVSSAGPIRLLVIGRQ